MIYAPIWCQPKGVKCLLGLNYQQRSKNGHRGDQSLRWKIMLIRGAFGQPNHEMNREDIYLDWMIEGVLNIRGEILLEFKGKL